MSFLSISTRYLGIVIGFVTIYFGSLTALQPGPGEIANTTTNSTDDCNALWESIMGYKFTRISEFLVVIVLSILNIAFIVFGIQAHRRVKSLWQKAIGQVGANLANTAHGTTLRLAFKRLLLFLIFCNCALIFHTVPLVVGWFFPTLSPHWTGDCQNVIFMTWIPDILPFLIIVALLWRYGYPLESKVGEGQRGIGLSGSLWNRQIRISLLKDPESASRLLFNDDLFEDCMRSLTGDTEDSESSAQRTEERHSDLSLPSQFLGTNATPPSRGLTPTPVIWVSVRCDHLLRQSLHQRIWEESMPTVGHVVAVHQANAIPHVAEAKAKAANQKAAAASPVRNAVGYVSAKSFSTKSRSFHTIAPTDWTFSGIVHSLFHHKLARSQS